MYIFLSSARTARQSATERTQKGANFGICMQNVKQVRKWQAEPNDTHEEIVVVLYTVPCKSSDMDVDMGDDTGKESKETERLLLLFVMATGKDDGRGIFYFREFLTATTL